mgnify:CR=1 FL=1
MGNQYKRNILNEYVTKFTQKQVDDLNSRIKTTEEALQWVSDNEILFNDYCYDTNKYISYCYNVNSGERIKTFDYPVQDSYFKSMFYSINYNRLQSSRPDYGYFNIPIHTQKELLSLEADGIWEIDFNSEKGKLIVSLEEVVGIESYSRYSAGLHWINHLMISPNGKRMIFLHRTRNQGVKRDRLFSYDIETHTLSLIINYSIISHFNWINNDSIICFWGENKADLAYKKINLLDLWNHFKNVILEVSCDGWGDAVEYSRTGFSRLSFLNNLKTVTAGENIQIYINCVVNIYSVWTLPELERFRNSLGIRIMYSPCYLPDHTNPQRLYKEDKENLKKLYKGNK